MIHGKFVKFLPKPIEELCAEDSVEVLRSKDESHGVERIHHLSMGLLNI